MFAGQRSGRRFLDLYAAGSRRPGGGVAGRLRVVLVEEDGESIRRALQPSREPEEFSW